MPCDIITKPHFCCSEHICCPTPPRDLIRDMTKGHEEKRILGPKPWLREIQNLIEKLSWCLQKIRILFEHSEE